MFETVPSSLSSSIGGSEAVLPVYDDLQPPGESVVASVEPKTHRIRKWLGRFGLAGLALAAAATAEVNDSGLPGHNQAELVMQLAETDATAEFHHIVGNQPEPFLVSNQSIEPQILNDLNSNFVANNNLFLSSSNIPFRLYATTWSYDVALDTENILSLIPGPDQNQASEDFDKSLAALNANYWAAVLGSLHGYVAKIAPLTTDTYPKFDDDDGWAALEDMQSPSDLKYAEQVFALAMSQIDKDGGGIYWQVQTARDSNHSRNLVSNAPFVMLGAELYQRTGKLSYLWDSTEIDNWIQRDLYNPKTGEYDDHIDPSGRLDTHVWTYGQGVMAGATAAMGNVTLAASDVNRDLVYFKDHHSYGNSAFDEIFFKNAEYVAGLANSPKLTVSIKAGLAEAIKYEPKDPSDLLDAAGDLGLQAEEVLPENQYRNLFFGTVAIKPKPYVISYVTGPLKSYSHQ